MDSNRRRFVLAGLSVVGAAGVGGWWALGGNGAGEEEGVGVELAEGPSCVGARIQATPGVAAMGSWYLARVPAEADVDLLARQLFGTPEPAGVEACIERLRQAIQEDYRTGGTMTVDGFVASRTELRLYAFLSLAARG